MSWGISSGRTKGVDHFVFKRWGGKCHFLFPLSTILSNTCVTRGSTGLDLGFCFSRNAEGFKCPIHQKGERKGKKSPRKKEIV